MVNIKVQQVTVLPAHPEYDGDTHLYDNEPANLVALITNSGGHTGQFKVRVMVDSSVMYDAWEHDLSGGAEDWVYVPLTHVQQGQHHVQVLADYTNHVAETEEYEDNIVEGVFEVQYRQVQGDAEKVEVTVSEKEWEKAGWKRASVYAKLWAYDNNPLSGYEVYLNVEGQSDWHRADGQAQHGAAEFHNLLLHPDGTLHLMCQSSDEDKLPKLEGQFDANINPNGHVQITAWQDAAIDTIMAQDQHSVARQLSASLQVSEKLSFKVLDIGAEASVTATVGGSKTTTDAHTSGHSYRVLYPRPALLDQKPQRPI